MGKQRVKFVVETRGGRGPVDLFLHPNKQLLKAKRVFREKCECKCIGFNAKTLLLASIHHMDLASLEILFSIDIV